MSIVNKELEKIQMRNRQKKRYQQLQRNYHRTHITFWEAIILLLIFVLAINYSISNLIMVIFRI